MFPMNYSDERTRNLQHFRTPEPLVRKLARLAGISAVPPLTLQGIDVSKWQPVINYAAYKAAGWSFAIVKATDGMIVDPQFGARWQGFLNAGVPVLTYHYFRDAADYVAQAALHLAVVSQLAAAQGGLACVLDLEEITGLSNYSRELRVRGWLERVNPVHQAGLYTSPYLWSLLMPASAQSWVNNFWLWPASWTSAAAPVLPSGWAMSQVKFWQYGIAGKYPWCPPSVPGIAGAVDVDRGYFADEQELRDWLGLSGAPPPPPPLPAGDFSPAFQARILGNSGTFRNVRARPSTVGVDVGNLYSGAIVDVHSELILSPDEVWWLVVDPAQAHLAGWVAAVYGGVTYAQRV